MMATSDRYELAWKQVEAGLDRLLPVTGGFSFARRGLVRLTDNTQIFVKIGTEKNSKVWAQKEVAVYQFLKKNSYSYIPEFLSSNSDDTAFALEALTPEKGWDWSDTWTDERLAATLHAVDNLAKLKPKEEAWMTMGQLALDESRDGWAALVSSTLLKQVLIEKLRAAKCPKLAETLDIGKEAERSSHFTFRKDALVHNDVRADNCAWNSRTREVKLVDWNWTEMGDKRINSSAMLVHVQKSGFDVTHRYADRLDGDALQWMAGFWFNAAATPIWPGGPAHLRDFQLQSGISAMKLAQAI